MNLRILIPDFKGILAAISYASCQVFRQLQGVAKIAQAI